MRGNHFGGCATARTGSPSRPGLIQKFAVALVPAPPEASCESRSPLWLRLRRLFASIVRDRHAPRSTRELAHYRSEPNGMLSAPDFAMHSANPGIRTALRAK